MKSIRQAIKDAFSNLDAFKEQRREKQILKSREKFEVIGVVADPRNPKQPLLTKYNTKIPVRRQVKFDNSKWTGAQLREIRRKQTLQAIEGRGTFNDGSPIFANQLVDLWEHNNAKV